MDQTRIDDFKAELDRRGYPHAVKSWDAGYQMDEHSHDFAVEGLILSGSFTITTDEGTKTFSEGDRFSMVADCPHSEEAGPDGVTFLVGRSP